MNPCDKCGFESNQDANFCSRCGSRLLHSDPSETTISFAPSAIDEAAAPVATPHRESVPMLLIRSGGGREGETIALASDLLTVGRSPESHLFLDDVTVSRHHARVIRDATGYMVEDLNSLNGTYVNRRRVERHHLADGDEVQIGKFKLAFLEPQEP